MTRIRIDTALRFYHEVLGLEHLHYGLWNGEPVGIEGLRSAQRRYAEYLIEWIPEGVERIVDVGCGTGAFSALLQSRGFVVEGLSPDPHQGELYVQRTGRPFHLSGFAEFDAESAFDLVVMSESAQYVRPADGLFRSALRNAPGGHLLVSDYFVTSDEKGVLTKSGHPLRSFLEASEAHGLVLDREEDITEAALPTLDCARRVLDAFQRGRSIVEESWSRKHPYLYRSLRWLLRKKLRELDSLEVLADAEAFRRAKRYMIYRFRIPEAAGAGVAAT